MPYQSKSGMIYVPIYFNYRLAFDRLSDTQRGRLLSAIMNYAEFGIAPEFDGDLAMAFDFIRGRYDLDSSSYDRRKDTSRQNGKKGGRPPKPEDLEKPKKPKNQMKERMNERMNERISSSSNDDARESADDDDDFNYSPVVDALYRQICAILPVKVPEIAKADISKMLSTGMSRSEIELGIGEAAARDAKSWVYVKKAIMSAKTSMPSGHRVHRDKLAGAGILVPPQGNET